MLLVKESHTVFRHSFMLLAVICLAVPHYSCKSQPSSEPKTTKPPTEVESVKIVRDMLPDGAPEWLRVRVQTGHDEKRAILETSGVVFGIQNRELAINAASSRALHEASAWLQTPSLKGLKVIETAYSKEKYWAAARIQVPLPDNWTPPTPLPESKLP